MNDDSSAWEDRRWQRQAESSELADSGTHSPRAIDKLRLPLPPRHTTVYMMGFPELGFSAPAHFSALGHVSILDTDRWAENE